MIVRLLTKSEWSKNSYHSGHHTTVRYFMDSKMVIDACTNCAFSFSRELTSKERMDLIERWTYNLLGEIEE